MKNSILVGVLATSLLPLVLGSTSAIAANFLQKTITCPASNVVLVVPDEGQIRIADMIISASENTDFILKYFGEDANRTVVKLWLNKNRTVVSNFQEGIEGDIDQGLKATCNGNGQVSLTIVGT